MNREELLKKLIEMGAREFNLEKGFQQFEIWFNECVGLGTREFDWVDENDEEIVFRIEFGNVGVGPADSEGDFEEYETVYEIR